MFEGKSYNNKQVVATIKIHLSMSGLEKFFQF